LVAVIETNKRPRQPADAALQSDAVSFSFFFTFRVRSDGPSLFVEVAFGGIGIVGLELVEIAELVSGATGLSSQ